MKQLLCLLFAAVAVTACAPAVPAGEFRIVGKIENVPDSAVVRLYEPQGQMLRGMAVDTLVDGRFSFRDTISSPKALQVCLHIGAVRVSRRGFGKSCRTFRSRETRIFTAPWSNPRFVN